jgi:hypothetical protein
MEFVIFNSEKTPTRSIWLATSLGCPYSWPDHEVNVWIIMSWRPLNRKKGMSRPVEAWVDITLDQPFSIFLPWRNPWNNFQVTGNPCIKIIISTAQGTLEWSVRCRYNNPIIIVNTLLSIGWYFSVDLFILANLLAYSFSVVPPPHKGYQL